MATRNDIDQLLARIGVLNHPCDLDLLLFFARHPRALVTSEQLSAWLGYELSQIAQSLDVLLGAKLITRTQNRAHPARLYVLTPVDTDGGWFPELLALALERSGRLSLREALRRRGSTINEPPDVTREQPSGNSMASRPFVVRRRNNDRSGTKTG